MEARTARETIVAQLFADLDGLTDRVEKLPSLVEAAGAQFTATTKALDEGADRYRQAITAFNSEARAELSEFVQRQSAAAAASVADSHRIALHEIVRSAFRTEASDKAASLATALERASKEMTLFRRSHLVETVITSVASSVISAALLFFALRH